MENQKNKKETINKKFEQHLEEIAEKWNAPSDFWNEPMSFTLDSSVLKLLLKEAFKKGTELSN